MPGWQIDNQPLDITIDDGLQMLRNRLQMPPIREWRWVHVAPRVSQEGMKRFLAIGAIQVDDLRIPVDAGGEFDHAARATARGAGLEPAHARIKVSCLTILAIPDQTVTAADFAHPAQTNRPRRLFPPGILQPGVTARYSLQRQHR